MNTQRFVILTLILTLSLVCLLNQSHAGQVIEGTVDFDTLATTMTVNATHLIVGEVIDVSFVFQQDGPRGTTGPISIATVRVDSDMKKEIERAENDDPDKGELDDKPEQFVSFSQIGGPYPDGDYVEAASIRLLKVGDYVFLRLSPTTFPITNNGVTVNNCTEIYGAVYTVENKRNDDDVNEHVIKKGWRSLDLSVGDMIRLVRAILKKPEEMRAFERDLSAPIKQARYQALRDKIKCIEMELGLPEL